jgi:cellulose synthase operon protein YhjQ
MGTTEISTKAAIQARQTRGSGRERISAGTPEDVAALYAWANLQGARYWDFSASRRDYREQVRARAAEALRERDAAEQASSSEERASADPDRSPAFPRRSERAHPSPSITTLSLSDPRSGELWKREFLRTNRVPIAQGFVEVSRETGRKDTALLWDPAPVRATHTPPIEDAGEIWKAGLLDEARFAIGAASRVPGGLSTDEQLPAMLREGLPPESSRQGGERSSSNTRLKHWPPRPAWFSEERPAEMSCGAPQSVRQGSIPGSAHRPPDVSDRMHEPQAAPATLIVFSLHSGTGRTSLLATLGRALATFQERVVLGDTGSYSELPLYFGARETRTGMARAYAPPDHSGDPSVFVATYELSRAVDDPAERNQIVDDIVKNGAGADRVLLDIAPGAEWLLQRLAALHPAVLVPVVPDRDSVQAIEAVERLFAKGESLRPCYLLNQFEPASALHAEIRASLEARLGGRLLPSVLRRSRLVGEALAEGVTVIDYAPGSVIVRDFLELATWVRALAPAALPAPAAWSSR